VLARVSWLIATLIPSVGGLVGFVRIVAGDTRGWNLFGPAIGLGLVAAFLAFLIADLPRGRALGTVLLACAANLLATVWTFAFGFIFGGGFPEANDPAVTCPQGGMSQPVWSYLPPGVICQEEDGMRWAESVVLFGSVE